jgi:hypothetical protein
MTLPKSPDPDGDGAPDPAAGKKAYEKPTFVREQVFETMALACGKINPTSGPCKSVRKNS